MTGLRCLAICLCTLAAACEVPTTAPTTSAPERHGIEVARTRYSHAVSFPSGDADLGADERAALRSFLADAGTRASDRIVVTAAGVAESDLAPDRRNAVLRYLRRLGYRPADPTAEGRGHPLPDADALVRVVRYHARLPKCPDRSRTRVSDFHNLSTSDFGCATAHNLGRMVANPRDLRRGRRLGPADAERQSKAVADYRKGKLPAQRQRGDEGGGFEFSGDAAPDQGNGGGGG